MMKYKTWSTVELPMLPHDQLPQAILQHSTVKQEQTGRVEPITQQKWSLSVSDFGFPSANGQPPVLNSCWCSIKWDCGWEKVLSEFRPDSSADLAAFSVVVSASV